MKRWRTDGPLRRHPVVALLALLVLAIAGWPNAGHAESQHSTPASLSRAKLERVGDFIRQEIAAGTMPGAVILIQQHGRPVYFESFGVRDVESRRPMTPDTIFRLYSMSKPITSVAAMMLVENGKLSLDDPVAKYIPAFAKVKVGVEKTDEGGKPQLSLDPLKRPVTIEDLMRHTSGLTYGFYGETAVRRIYDKSDIYDGDFDNATFVERLARLPLADQPGTRWDYGHSTDVLGRVIEVISGQSLFQFEKQRLLNPLGMTETAFYIADDAQRPRIAEPMPHDRLTKPVAGIKDSTLPRHWESGGGDDSGLCAFRADAPQRRHAGWQALPQAGNDRPDGVGSYRAGDQDHSRPLLFSRRNQRLRARLCRAHRGAAEYVLGAGRISLGRRRRDLLFCRPAR